jgi:hypothetical protein
MWTKKWRDCCERKTKMNVFVVETNNPNKMQTLEFGGESTHERQEVANQLGEPVVQTLKRQSELAKLDYSPVLASLTKTQI